MAIETSVVKAGPQDNFGTNLFFAETVDGSYQVAHSDKTFFGSADIQAPDSQAAFDDLVAKLQTLGWHQVVGTIPSPWYNLTFQREMQEPLRIETSVVKAGPQDDFGMNLFFAETLDGSYQVAHSDKTFSDSPDIESQDAQDALNDLVAKLHVLGWHQVTEGIPSPWYSLEFQRVIS